MIYRAVRQDWLLNLSLLLESASEDEPGVVDDPITKALGVVEDILLSAPRFSGLSEEEKLMTKKGLAAKKGVRDANSTDENTLVGK